MGFYKIYLFNNAHSVDTEYYKKLINIYIFILVCVKFCLLQYYFSLKLINFIHIQTDMIKKINNFELSNVYLASE